MSLLPAVKPPGIVCPMWEPASEGSKRCKHYENATCVKPDVFRCVEWLRKNEPASVDAWMSAHEALWQPVSAERATLNEPESTPAFQLSAPAASAPASPGRASGAASGAKSPKEVALGKWNGSRRVPLPGGGEAKVAAALFVREIPAESIESLEKLGMEVELQAPHLEGGKVWLVPAKTGKDRLELTFRDAATIRLIVDAFPGAHVIAIRKKDE